MGEIRNFRDDRILKPFLDAIPKNKRSKVIRRALYNYFFKGEDKIMLEDEEESYNMVGNVGVEEEQEGIKPVKEINFNMFDD